MEVALLIINGALIAGLYALGRELSQEGIAPLELLYWQVLSSTAIVGAVALLRREVFPVSASHLRYYLYSGLLGTMIPYMATYTSLTYLASGIVGVVGSLSAIFTYAIARLGGLERGSCIRAVGIVLGLIGVLGILLPKGAIPGSGSGWWVLLATAAPLSLAGGNVYRSHAWPTGLSPIAAATGMLAVQLVVLTPVIALSREHSTMLNLDADTSNLKILLFSLVASGIYYSSFLLQRKGGAVVVSQLGYVMAVFSLLIGTFVLGEQYSLWVWLGVGLVFSGVYLVTRRPKLPLCPTNLVRQILTVGLYRKQCTC